MSSSNFFQQFNENKLKGNRSKYHLLLSSDENIDPNIGTSQIKNSNYEKLFRVNIDSNLSFENHINLLSTKARARFLNKGKRKLLMKPFFKYQFSYCSLSWLFLSFTLNNKINRLHDRCLRRIYNGNTSSFSEILEIHNSFSIHHRNIQVLATELYKVGNVYLRSWSVIILN